MMSIEIHPRVQGEVEAVEAEHRDSNGRMLLLRNSSAFSLFNLTLFTHQSRRLRIPIPLTSPKKIHQSFRDRFRKS